ncbi:class I SAM-dependent methyltransferase [Actinospongicola halichondriae]|uniref:class I SAM-dependent methyltransferase n=1 Tax=Actinospongicola halichondriae TaxID=3236844 RepID=UPI003D4A8A94
MAPHDSTVHERLHSATNSSYGTHRQIGDAVVAAYQREDAGALADLLEVRPAQRFVIETVTSSGLAPEQSQVLDVGCSSGYLTAFFLTAGYNAIGVDVSPTAVSAAAARFGPHFHAPDSSEVEAMEPFDAIFHVGTVGCVDDPDSFIRRQLGQLRPGGLLAFNAPNAEAARARGLVWGVSTPPPDLVTLFTPSFFTDRFADIADVRVVIEKVRPGDELMRRLRRKRIVDPEPTSALLGQSQRQRPPLVSRPGRSIVDAVADLGARARLLRSPAAEYGIHVTMRRRG